MGATGELRVRLFASLRERAGWAERRLPLAEGPPLTAAGVWQQLGLDAIEPGAQGIRVAINQQFASAEHPLAAGDELAFLPPISGG